MLRTGRQPGQVFYHRKPGGSGGNGFKLPPNVGRGVWFGIETIMLTQPTREKNINRGLGLAESFALFLGGYRAQALQLGHRKPGQSQNSAMNRRSAIHFGMGPEC